MARNVDDEFGSFDLERGATIFERPGQLQRLEDFALFLSRSLGITPKLTVADALTFLFKQSSPSAHEITIAFRQHLITAGLAPSGVNRHLATLRSLTKLGRMLGMMSWYIELSGIKAERRRQVVGPTVEEIRRILAATSHDTEADTRAYAIVMVLFTMGLRVSELCGLNLEETNLDRGQTWVLGKGRRELVPIPAPTVEAIRQYLKHRIGPARGPLFLTRGSRGRNRDDRLETRSVLRIVRELGERVGLHLWCHSLRHSGITVAVEQSTALGLSLDKVRAYSRHRGINTLLTYIDDRDRDRNQRSLADVVAGTLAG
jgi:integrase